MKEKLIQYATRFRKWFPPASLGEKLGKCMTLSKDWFFPPVEIELLPGGKGAIPTLVDNTFVRFKFDVPIYVQQMLHEVDPGGSQTFTFDIWCRVPKGHIAVLSPIAEHWHEGRILIIPKYFSPGWAGNLTYTAINAHPEQPTGLPSGIDGFEMVLTPIVERVWTVQK